MTTVRFYLKRPNDYQPSVIYARFSFNMTTYKYYLLEKILPADWNSKTQKAKQGAKNFDSFEFNQHLKEIASKISDAFYNYQNTHNGQAPTHSVFKEVLDGIFNKQSQARMDRELQRIESREGFSPSRSHG